MGKRPTRLGMLAWDYRQEIENQAGMIDTVQAMEMAANHKIRTAIEDGEFDNLPGKGKPLVMDKLGEDVSVKIMRNSGFTPAFAEKRKELDRERSSVMGLLRRAVQEVEARSGACAAPMSFDLIKTNSVWHSKRGEIDAAIKAYNKKVANYNLTVPAQMHVFAITVETAFKKL